MKKRVAFLLSMVLCATMIPAIGAGAQPNASTGGIAADVQLFCDITEEKNFDDDSVLVVMKKENSEVNQPVTKEEFPEVESAEVEDITKIDGDPSTKELLNQGEFRQIISIHIEKQGQRGSVERGQGAGKKGRREIRFSRFLRDSGSHAQ